MKVQCGQCPAKYAVLDERVLDRKVRIQCKRCGASIIIDGKVNPPLITTTPARPSVRPPSNTAPLPESPPSSEPEAEARPSPRPVAHTIMGGLEAPAAERLQQQIESPLSRPMRSLASPHAAFEPESVDPHMPADHRGLTDPPAGAHEDRWRVALTKQDLRWMTTDEIVEAFRAGAVKTETFVFRAGMPTWVTLPEVPEIALALADARNGAASASSLPPPMSPSSRPPSRKMPGRSSADEADPLAALAEFDAAEPLPFALVAARSNGAHPTSAGTEEARQLAAAPPPAHADDGPALSFESDRPSLEAMPIDHLSHVPDEPFEAAPLPFAAAQQASGSSRWVWVAVGLFLLAAAGAWVAGRLGLKLF